MEAIALGSLVASAGCIATYYGLQPSHPDALVNSTGAAMLGFLATLLGGILPVVLLGAPIYTWLLLSGRATWPSALLLGALPAFVVLAFDREAAVMALVSGVVTAGLTHWGASRWMRPDGAREPNPLRESI